MDWMHVYSARGLEADQVRATVDRILQELKRDSAARKKALEQGIDVDVALSHAEDLRIEQGSAGLTPEVTDIIVKVVGAAGGAVVAQMLRDLWSLVILPRLKSRFGDDSLKLKS
jgi:hypothetical protein